MRSRPSSAASAARCSSPSRNRSIRRASPSPTSINFMLNCFLGGLGYVFGPMLGTFVLYFGWDLLFQTGEFQLLIFSSVLIALMLVLPNGLLSLAPARHGRRAEPMAELLQVSRPHQALRRPRRRQRRLLLGARGRDPFGHRAERRRQVDAVQADLVVPAADRRRSALQGRAHLRPGAAHRGPQGRRADLPGDDDLQGHDGARQRHHRAPSALQGEPARLLSSARRSHGRRGRLRPLGRRDPRVPRAVAARATRSPATCRTAICARSASPSAWPPTRRSCCSTSPSPA